MPNTPLEHFAHLRTVSSWDGMLEFSPLSEPEFPSWMFGPSWIFRGMGNAEYGLLTSFERCLLWADRDMTSNDYCHSQIMAQLHPLMVKANIPDIRTRLTLEDQIIREFRRKCHNVLPPKDIPDENDTLEWLSLMQHYGAPTNMLDWTYSFFVAVFFAIEDADKPCAVWCLDADWIVKDILKQSDILSPSQKDVLNTDTHLQNTCSFKTLLRSGKSFVCPFSPFRLNERLTVQQGVFLMSGNGSIPFEDNLVAMLSKGKSSDHHLQKITIEVSAKEKRKILHNLSRMNISRASLFPGIDGFSKSLNRSRQIFEHQYPKEIDAEGKS